MIRKVQANKALLSLIGLLGSYYITSYHVLGSMWVLVLFEKYFIFMLSMTLEPSMNMLLSKQMILSVKNSI